MEQIAYVVTSGSYSDYSIRAVFSTKERAEAYIEDYKRAEVAGYTYGNDDPSIEEWTVDEVCGNVWKPRFVVMVVVSTGEATEQQYGGPTREYVAENYDGRTDFDKERGLVWGRSHVSQEHALKLATERRQAILRERA